MPISRELSQLASVLTVKDSDKFVGIGSTQPTAKLDVGGAVVAVAFTGDGSGLTGVVADTVDLSSVDSINASGIITASSFVGDGSNLTGISAGIGTEDSINTTGVITATSFVGDGSNLSGISVNRFLSVNTRVGVVTVTTFAGILTVFGRTSDTNILV